MTQIFDIAARNLFAENYPEGPHKLHHDLQSHELLTLDALAKLGDALPEKSVEYNKSDLPIGVDPDKVEANGLTISETIRTVEQNGSWAVLKNVEQVPAYEELLMQLLGELRPIIEARTGRMMTPQAFIFISSPGSVTPYHFDPEHNILLQLVGGKTMKQFPAEDRTMATLLDHERYHNGGHRNIVWNEEFEARGTDFHLSPGDAVYVPVMAPHYVRNDGPNAMTHSISLSITWRSDWSYAEADAHGFNRWLRNLGLDPKEPGRFPAKNRAKAYAYRALRKAGLTKTG